MRFSIENKENELRDKIKIMVHDIMNIVLNKLEPTYEIIFNYL